MNFENMPPERQSEVMKSLQEHPAWVFLVESFKSRIRYRGSIHSSDDKEKLLYYSVYRQGVEDFIEAPDVFVKTPRRTNS